MKKEKNTDSAKAHEFTDDELVQVSGGEDRYEMHPPKPEDTTENAHDNKDYSAGPNPLL